MHNNKIFTHENLDFQLSCYLPEQISSPPLTNERSGIQDMEFESIEMNLRSFPFQTAGLRYKNYEVELNSKDFLPRIQIGKNVLRKITKIVQCNRSKDSFLIPTQKSHDLNTHTFHFEDLIFNTDDNSDAKNPLPVYFAYQTMIEDGNQDHMLIDGIKQQIINNSLNCSSVLAQGDMGCNGYLQQDMVLQEQTLKKKDPRQIKTSDLFFLSTMRIFIVLSRTSTDHEEPSFGLHKLVYFPNTSFRLKHIHQPFKLVSSPLTTYLTRKNVDKALWNGKGGHKASSMSCGFICLDKNLRMLPIMPTDPICNSVPLLGIWLFGLSTKISTDGSEEEIQFLIAALQKYIASSVLRPNQYSLVPNKKSFLVILFSHDEHAHYYEVELVEDKLCNGEIIGNQWVLLKNSEHIRDLDQITYNPLSFYFNPNLLIRNTTDIHESFLKAPRLSSRSRNSFESCQQPVVGDLFEQYLGSEKNFSDYSEKNKTKKQTYNQRDSQKFQSAQSEVDDEEYGYQWSLPKPQPQPQLQPNPRLEDSKDYNKTATFIHGNDQTLTADLLQMSSGTFGGSFFGKNVLTDSIKGHHSNHMRSKSNINGQTGQRLSETRDSKTNQSNQSDSFSDQYTGDRYNDKSISPFAEKLLQQQASQLKFLQQQILNLQNALLKCTTQGVIPFEMLQAMQLNQFTQQLAAANLQAVTPIAYNETQEKTVGKPPLHTQKAQSIGIDAGNNVNPQIIQAQIKPATVNKSYLSCKSTNTTFNLSKTDINEQNQITQDAARDQNTNPIISNITSLLDLNILSSAEEDHKSSSVPDPQLNKSGHSTGHNHIVEPMDLNKVNSNRAKDTCNNSIAVSDCLHISLSKIHGKENETEAEEKLFTEDEILVKANFPPQNQNDSINAEVKAVNRSIYRDDEERPLCIQLDRKSLNNSREDKIQIKEKISEKTASIVDLPSEHNNKPPKPKLSSEKKQKSITLSQRSSSGNKENIDSNRKLRIMPKHFIVEDSNDTLESLNTHVIKLKFPEELGSSLKKTTASSFRTKLPGQADPSNQSLKIPKIKFDSKEQESDSSDDDMKKLEQRYLKRIY